MVQHNISVTLHSIALYTARVANKMVSSQQK